MSESPDNPAAQACAALGSIVDELSDLTAAQPEATLDLDQLSRTERAISMGIAMLVATRDEAATALEASVAGAAPRNEPALASDLLLIADVLHRALTRALAATEKSEAPAS